MTVDLLFPARGSSVPADHGYVLYAALSRVVPAIHEPESDIRCAPLTGLCDEPGRLRLTDRSYLRLRLPSDAIPTALPLAGRAIEVAGTAVRFGPPTVRTLIPTPSLAARIVTFKHGEEPETFLATAKTKLAVLDIVGEPTIPVFESGPREGQPRRRVVRIKGRAMVGYALVVSGLSADESIRLQERGLGGRTRLGCGFFLPVKEGE